MRNDRMPGVLTADEYVGDLLTQWARWRAGENRSGLGYTRSRAYQPEAAGGYKEARVPLMNRDIERVDEFIKWLPDLERQTLTAHYCEAGGVQMHCERLGLSRGSYFELVRAAKRMLAHWLREDRTAAGVSVRRIHAA